MEGRGVGIEQNEVISEHLAPSWRKPNGLEVVGVVGGGKIAIFFEDGSTTVSTN